MNRDKTPSDSAPGTLTAEEAKSLEVIENLSDPIMDDYATLSYGTNYKALYEQAMIATNEAGFMGMTPAEVIDEQDREIMSLRAERTKLRETLKLVDGFLLNKGYSEHDPLVRGAIRDVLDETDEAKPMPTIEMLKRI